MKNFIFSLLAAGAGIALNYAMNLPLISGIFAGLFAFLIAYVVLVRRSFGKLNRLVQVAMAEVQAAQSQPDPAAQVQCLDKGIALMADGFKLSKEQFLMEGILKGQVGSLHYQGAALYMQMKLREDMQRNNVKSRQLQAKANKRFKEAKVFLLEANKRPWQIKLTRNWQAMGMLAALHFRDGEKEQAVECLKSVRGPGGSDPMFWGVYAWLLHESNRKSDALLELNSGLEKNKNSQALTGMIKSIQNKEPLDFTGFGMSWFMFFPEHLTPKIAMKLQAQMDEGANQPMSRAMRRKMNRQK